MANGAYRLPGDESACLEELLAAKEMMFLVV